MEIMMRNRTWRPQGSPLLYYVFCPFSSIVVATLAVAMFHQGRHVPRTRLSTSPDASRLLLDDNGGLHRRVDLAMVGECASFGKGEAERSTIRGNGSVDARVERCAIIAGDGMWRAGSIGPGDGCSHRDGDGSRVEAEILSL